ncbi:MAG TPA: exopolyphosphatase [Steroidobacteraceae bacterium]|nr:exopolyphosphatase [Steroidobacteraceae bacterium]
MRFVVLRLTLSKAQSKVPDVIAAVDLGSNSFHMVVARYSHGQLTILDRLREMVRLAAGLDAEDRLDKAVTVRALECLQRFGQRLRDMHAENVRVVGTNTLRKAHRKQTFLERARDALGHPIEIISGIEEARLIYLGVANTIPNDPGRRLVVDIGGGSTEVIIGEGFNPLRLESLYMGCVGMSLAHFGDGKISEKRFRRARMAARLELEPVQAAFRSQGWQHAFGSSGTIRVIADIIRHFDPTAVAITPEGLERVIHETIEAGHVNEVHLPEVTAERAPVFPGGLAILAELFEALEVEQMRIADGALREGLLYDMIGRFTDEDARTRTVRAMEQRYHVDIAQAERVESTALDFLRQVAAPWGLSDPLAELALGWAARLHEIGLDVSHSHYQRHGAYLLEHADLPGFPREEQMLLAALVGGHRRKIIVAGSEELIPPWDKKALFLLLLLRLAVLMHRGRTSEPLPPITLLPRGQSLTIEFPRGWLKDHPLTIADLRNEVDYWKAIGFRLRVFDFTH